MRVGIFGRGRLGCAIADSAESQSAESQGWDLAWCLGRGDEPDTEREAVDVAIDASTAAAVPRHVEWAIDAGCQLVIGATGWQIDDLEQRVASRIGVLIAPNFSLAVALMKRMSRVLGRYAALDEQLDPFITDHHHRAKADAPSGTARLLADALIQECPRKTGWTMSLQGAIADDQLSLGVVRSGGELGAHTVGVDSPWDLIELRHRARSRETFAIGALNAARWLGKRRGVYHFDDFAAQTLDPLFRIGNTGDT